MSKKLFRLAFDTEVLVEAEEGTSKRELEVIAVNAIYAGKVNDVRDCLLTVELDEDGSDIHETLTLF